MATRTLSISDTGMTRRGSRVLRSVRCNRALKHLFFTSGVHYWEVDIARADKRAKAMVVGAVPSERFDGETLNGPLAAWTGGAVGYAAYGAVLQNGSEVIADVEPFGEGDVVGVLLDLNARTIVFFLNGREVAHVAVDETTKRRHQPPHKRVPLAPIHFTPRAMFAAVTFAPETDRFDIYATPLPGNGVARQLAADGMTMGTIPPSLKSQ